MTKHEQLKLARKNALKALNIAIDLDYNEREKRKRVNELLRVTEALNEYEYNTL